MKHVLGWELHSSLFSSSLTREIHHFKLILLLERDFHGYFYVRSLCWGNDQQRDWDDVVFAYCYLKRGAMVGSARESPKTLSFDHFW